MIAQTLSTVVDWRESCLKRFGDFTLAYATRTDPMLEFFGDASGYIAFRKFWGYIYVLGDPVASDEYSQKLIDRFLACYPSSMFCQITDRTAKLLHSIGYWVNEMGVDTVLDLKTYHFQGKQRASLRYSTNWLQSHGYRIEEMSIDTELRLQMQQVIEQWRTKRVNKREVVFLNRQAVLDDEEDVRKFVLFNPLGHLEAFVFFDPLYRDGEIIGYVTAIKRRIPQATPYAEMGICKWAIEQFQSEGKEVLRLGLSPLASIENRQYRHVRPMHYSWHYLHRAWWVNRFFYNFKGHAQFKRRFGGMEEKTYFASPVFFNDLRIIGWLRMLRLI